jgi:hypothetical protein
VLNLKKQFTEIKKELKKKSEELEELKKTTKSTKINELSIENKELNDELIKIKKFYEISIEQNMLNEKQLLEFGDLQESFNKQQYMLLTYEENLRKFENEMKTLSDQNRRLNATVAEKNQINLKLKKDLKLLHEKAKLKDTTQNNTLSITNSIPLTNTAAEKAKKSELEKKLNVFKREVLYYKELCSKKESRIRELEKEKNNMNQTNLQQNYIKHDENPEEHINTTILLLKSKLIETKKDKDNLEKLNKELIERLRVYENGTYSESNKSRIKSYDLMNDEQLNELVYILIKNLEAAKIDSHIVESRVFNSISASTIDDKAFFDDVFNNFINMLNVKNDYDMIQIGSFIKTFIHYHKDLSRFI